VRPNVVADLDLGGVASRDEVSDGSQRRRDERTSPDPRARPTAFARLDRTKSEHRPPTGSPRFCRRV